LVDQIGLQPNPAGDSAIKNRVNNYNLTNLTQIGKFYCPITTTLLPNKRYVLNIDLSYTITAATGGSLVFSNANIEF